jgi:hypothetical protein
MKLAQVFGCLWQCLNRIEGISQSALGGCTRHELGNALRMRSASGSRPDCIRIEPAFAPDDPN